MLIKFWYSHLTGRCPNHVLFRSELRLERIIYNHCREGEESTELINSYDKTLGN